MSKRTDTKMRHLPDDVFLNFVCNAIQHTCDLNVEVLVTYGSVDERLLNAVLFITYSLMFI